MHITVNGIILCSQQYTYVLLNITTHFQSIYKSYNISNYTDICISTNDTPQTLCEF